MAAVTAAATIATADVDRSQSRKGGEYGVATFGDNVPRVREDEVFLVQCPTCRARYHPRLKDVGRKARCGDCGRTFTIPAPAPPEPAPPAPWVEEAGEFGVGEAAERPPLEMEVLLAPKVAVYDDEKETTLPAPVPRAWLMKGVWTFPFHVDSLPHVGYITLILAGIAAFLTVLIAVGRILNVPGIAAPLFGAVVVLLPMMWAMSALISCCMAIISDTAAGYNKIPNWPEGAWSDWLTNIVWAAFLFLVTTAAPGILTMPLRPIFGDATSSLIALTISQALFPLLLFGAIESDNAFLPDVFSAANRLRRVPWATAAVFLFCAALSIGWLFLIAGAFRAGYGAGLACVALTLTPMAFIYARLMGRLLWRLGETEMKDERKAERRRKRRAQARGLDGAIQTVDPSQVAASAGNT